MLNTAGGILYMPFAQSPHSSDRADILGRSERIPQQAKGVQLHQPLAFLHVRFAARKIFGVARIHQKDLQSLLFQDIVYGEPVNACLLYTSARRGGVLAQRRWESFALAAGAKPPFLCSALNNRHDDIVFQLRKDEYCLLYTSRCV